MKKNFIFVGIFLLILCSFQKTANAQNWRDKLIPLQASIHEIERILVGKPFNARVLTEQGFEDRHIYYFAEGTLTVYFSLGRCIDGLYGKFELAEGVIIQASFVPKKWYKISHYEEDVKSLKKDTSDAPRFISYENVKKGISYTLQQGKVSEITFSGPENINLVTCKD